MKNLLSACCFLLLIVCRTNAQTTSGYLSEDFTDTTGTIWAIDDNKYCIADFRDGEYFMQSKTADGLYSSIPGVVLGKKKQFVISYTATWIDGVTNYGYGLAWGESSSAKANIFLVAANRYFEIRQKGKKEKSIVAASFCSFIKEAEPNKFRIESDGKKVKVLVNGVIVFNNKLKQWPGTFYLFMYEKQTVTFDNVSVTYSK